MSDSPKPGEYDEAKLLDAIRRMLSEGRAGASTEQHPGQALYGAYVRACREDKRYGNLAGLILFWITGGQGQLEILDIADEILNGTTEDRRRAKVHDVVHRLATGTITWDDFAKVTKKGLIPKPRPEGSRPAPQAIPLADATTTLETLLREAIGTAETPTPATALRAFIEFAHRPVAGSAALHVANDICLFQWGIHDWGSGGQFECGFIRQFVLHDSDDDYDHMEQLSLTVLFDPDDPDLLDLGSGDLWSGDELDSWVHDVERNQVFSAVSLKSAQSLRLDHSDV
jgi:hypothetical protein